MIEPGIVNGRSMEQTFFDDDFFLVNKITLLFREPKRGDVVIVQEPNTDKIMIKRVIGLPKEKLFFDLTGIHITEPNNKKFLLPEPYLEPETITRSGDGKITWSTMPIPDHSYYLLGDNRPNSGDSRKFSVFYRNQIYGLVMKSPFSKK